MWWHNANMIPRQTIHTHRCHRSCNFYPHPYLPGPIPVTITIYKVSEDNTLVRATLVRDKATCGMHKTNGNQFGELKSEDAEKQKS